MFPVKAICDRRSRKFGNPVCIQYCYRPDQRTVLNTEIYIPIRYWHRKLCRVMHELPPQYGDAEIINSQITAMIRMVEDMVGMAVRQKLNPLEFVKNTFHPNLDLSLLNEKSLLVKEKTQKTKEEKANLDILSRPRNTLQFLLLILYLLYSDLCVILQLLYDVKRLGLSLIFCLGIYFSIKVNKLF